jgi:hypothetical protein
LTLFINYSIITVFFFMNTSIIHFITISKFIT